MIFVSHYVALYGANRSLLALIDGLRPHGLEPVVLLPGTGPMGRELAARDIPYQVFGFRKWMGRHRIKAPLRAACNLAVIPAMLRWIGDLEPDVMYTNSSVVPVGAYLALLLKVPHVWHLREFGEADYGLKRDFGDAWFRYWLGRSEALVSVSRSLQDAVTEGIDTRKYVVYNGVATIDQAEHFRPQSPDSRSSDSPFTFAIVGLLSPRKGQTDAIRALARLSSRGVTARLLVAGSGSDSYERRLETLSRDLDVAGKTSFMGYVENPFDVYGQADAVLMCSEREAMGRVTAEAMIAARPVVGRRTGGTPELVTDGLNGLLYDGSVSELADCMEKLALDSNWARELGRHGWHRARQEFVVETNADRIAAILEEVQSIGGSK